MKYPLYLVYFAYESRHYFNNNENKRSESFLKQAYYVDHIGVFGSVARGDNTEISDIDILVQFTKPIGMFKFLELEEYLSQILGKKVDLVTNKALKPAMVNEVLQEVVYV